MRGSATATASCPSSALPVCLTPVESTSRRPMLHYGTNGDYRSCGQASGESAEGGGALPRRPASVAWRGVRRQPGGDSRRGARGAADLQPALRRAARTGRRSSSRRIRSESRTRPPVRWPGRPGSGCPEGSVAAQYRTRPTRTSTRRFTHGSGTSGSPWAGSRGASLSMNRGASA